MSVTVSIPYQLHVKKNRVEQFFVKIGKIPLCCENLWKLFESRRGHQDPLGALLEPVLAGGVLG